MYKTPGVYIEEIPKFPPSIAPVETAIPAFIGYTEKAKKKEEDDLILKPQRIDSIADYRSYFGEAQEEENIEVVIDAEDGEGQARFPEGALRSKHIMYYALQLFFDNGGGPCYIVSTGKYKGLGDDLVQTELKDGLDTLVKVDEPTLIIFPEAQSLSISDFSALHDAALKQCYKLKDRFVIMDVHGGDISMDDPDSDIRDAVLAFRDGGIGTNHLKYGAAYAPNIETILDFSYKEESINVKIGDAESSLQELKESDNRNYERARALLRDMPCKMPPSAAMAGIYAAVDNSRGVWKAPANVSVNAVIQPTIQISRDDQEDLNVDTVAGKSVNAIRSFTGKGTLVWGARTLAGNDNEWRYISVRRFFNFAEESIKKATEQFVFEPNDANTWVRVQAMIENFLTTQWRQGALQGVKPEHAFYVAVGLGKTMTAQNILRGEMIIEIGMAVVRPAEFIILRFSHKMAES
ncbi:MAG: phage tail sheath family protein [Candidatus Electrothrix sp. EH2]|nr:phage tail sheath family protein [Candidatus Electrothrix sp. EH2]